MPEELILITELVCGQIAFPYSNGLTIYKSTETEYKVFVSNGWFEYLPETLGCFDRR